MALDAATAQELIQRLNSDREAYLQSVNKTHQLLIQAIASARNTTAAPHVESSDVSSLTSTFLPARLNSRGILRQTAASSEVESLKRDFQGSIVTADDEDSDFDDSESLFVDQPLEPEEYTLEGLKDHILNYRWTPKDKEILQDLVDPIKLNEYFQRKSLFPTGLGDEEDRSHLTHYSIFDVGSDGAPLPILDPTNRGPVSRSESIWNRIKSTNADSARQRKAVGRITIVREPSPLLFAALHYTHTKHFDVDELFSFLVDDDPALARPPDAFSADHRVQRSFSFTMEYFTLIGEGCEPMAWQRSDPSKGLARTHIPISRCSSVVSLSLEGPPMGHVKNKKRRAKKDIGNVHDPFSPWRVLSITAYPDLRSSLDAHDTTKHYVNGPEAFLVTLRAEYKDATKRLRDVYKAICDMVDPPTDFIFNLETRDKLLFEDGHFTYSRRYFWAYQTLGIMNEDINDMVTAYYESFKEGVWNGSDKIIWPGAGDGLASAKHTNWRKRMTGLRRDLEHEVRKLKEIEKLNIERMRIVKNLHNNLFNGTSVYESRRSVENAMITVQQGRNIKLLTLVTIFFLPLTFVTSVFGMTNMPQHGPMDHFAYATVAICVPTYILIGSLNTQSGMKWWSGKMDALFSGLAVALAEFLAFLGYRPKWASKYLGRHGHKRIKEEEPIVHKNRAAVARRQSMELVPRGTFSGMPVLSPHNTDMANGHQTRNEKVHRGPYSPTQPGNKEKDRNLLRPHRSSNPATTGAIPPHRPSIGVVALPGQTLPVPDNEALATDSDIDPLEVPPPPRESPPSSPVMLPRRTTITTPAADEAGSEISGNSNTSSNARKRSVLGRIFSSNSGKSRRKKDEFP